MNIQIPSRTLHSKKNVLLFDKHKLTATGPGLSIDQSETGLMSAPGKSFGQTFRGLKTLAQRRLRTDDLQISGLTPTPLHHLGICHWKKLAVLQQSNIVNHSV